MGLTERIRNVTWAFFLEVADDNEEGVLRMCRRDHEMATLSDKVKQTD